MIIINYKSKFKLLYNSKINTNFYICYNSISQNIVIYYRISSVSYLQISIFSLSTEKHGPE